MGGIPAIQLGHRPEGKPRHAVGGRVHAAARPPARLADEGSAVAYGGDMPYPPQELTVDEIHELYAAYAQAATWAAEVGLPVARDALCPRLPGCGVLLAPGQQAD